jgi:hypothetical protein
MFTRRILACACALALAVPAAASARAGFDPPAQTQHVAYGDTKYDLQNQQDLSSPVGDTSSPKGDTKYDVAPAASKSALAISRLSDKELAAAYGTAQPNGSPVTSAPSTHYAVVPAGKSGGRLVVVNRTHRASGAGSSNDLDGWRLAALVEAGVLAAMALAGASVVTRTRPRRGATA